MIDQRKQTNLIVIHSSATPASMDIGAKEIDVWHRQRGFAKIGYHFVIRRDGAVETGRQLDEIGAHARPRNFDSVGICMIGGTEADAKTPEDNFTWQQRSTLETVIGNVLAHYPDAVVIGHRDVPGTPGTACPSFDVAAWWTGVNAIKAIGG